MTQTAPSVAIVLLNYNGHALTVDCLNSLRAIDYPNYRVIVVDNGSARDEGALLQQEFGDFIDVIRHQEALGFCAGNNVGIRRALARDHNYFLLLNNDTTVEPDFLTGLVRLMESDPRIGLAGPRILRHDDRSRLDSIGGDINLWIARAVNFRRPYGRVRKDLRFVSGCAFMLRRQAMEQVGYLEEDFYTYWEETDYCLRLRRAGWKIACDPASVIYHKVGQTNRYLSDRYVYYMIRNALLCMKRNGRWYQWPTFLLAFALTIVAKYWLYLLVRRPRDLPVVAQALGDYWHHRLGRKDFESTPAVAAVDPITTGSAR